MKDENIDVDRNIEDKNTKISINFKIFLYFKYFINIIIKITKILNKNHKSHNKKKYSAH